MVNDGAPTPNPGDGLRATGKWYRLVWSKGNAAMVPERQFRRMDSREYKSAVVEYYSVVGVPGSSVSARVVAPRRWNGPVKSVPSSENNVK
ncbi:hypothetical protein K0M31_015572 [Melipona bicolor]|uniref:Uncharacterized protein n=1 Tax=Melipona bicolor TaxID=60889 RepID=A0AA40KF01_9HYME|nr:hypothetical protein K0M31_015572 [Melipona bicolor]